MHDLKGHQAIVLPMVGEFGGRIIDTAGDGILAEFPSVVNAVKCAVSIQSEMIERNAAINPKHRMQFRVGINVGDVIYDEARIYGDGINVAARLEGIADPGGICISSKVYEEINGRFDFVFEDMGPQQLKNITRPVRAYRVRLDGRTLAASPTARAARQAIHRRSSVPEHERRSRAGTFLRWSSRGHHHDPVEARRACGSSRAIPPSFTRDARLISVRRQGNLACDTCLRAVFARAATAFGSRRN